MSYRLAVPAYWPAGTAQGSVAFDRLTAAAPTVETVIVNGPASGPAVPFDPHLAAAIRRLRGRGVTVLGYVDTGYLGRTGQTTSRVAAGSRSIAAWRAQANADSAAWRRLYAGYGLGGVFFDQTLSDRGAGNQHLNAYGAIAARTRSGWAGAVVVINPGTAAAECYTRVADVIVIAENSLAAYRSWAPPAWVRDYPRDRFWHLIHGATGAGQLTEALTLAEQRNAGRVFATDAVLDGLGGPWNVLPGDPYWSKQLATVAAGGREHLTTAAGG